MNDDEIQRQQSVLFALHSDAMENGTAQDDEEFVRWMDKWARGDMTQEDVRDRLNERYRRRQP